MKSLAFFPKKVVIIFYFFKTFFTINSISCSMRIQIWNKIRNQNASQFRFRWGKKLRFRFRLPFHNTAYSINQKGLQPPPVLQLPSNDSGLELLRDKIEGVNGLSLELSSTKTSSGKQW